MSYSSTTYDAEGKPLPSFYGSRTQMDQPSFYGSRNPQGSEGSPRISQTYYQSVGEEFPSSSGKRLGRGGEGLSKQSSPMPSGGSTNYVYIPAENVGEYNAGHQQTKHHHHHHQQGSGGEEKLTEAQQWQRLQQQLRTSKSSSQELVRKGSNECPEDCNHDFASCKRRYVARFKTTASKLAVTEQLHRYYYYFDTQNPNAWVGLWIDNGELCIGRSRFRGSSELFRFIRSHAGQSEGARHILANPIVDMRGDRNCTVRSTMIVLDGKQPPAKVLATALCYWELCLVEDDSWKICYHSFELDPSWRQ